MKATVVSHIYYKQNWIFNVVFQLMYLGVGRAENDWVKLLSKKRHSNTSIIPYFES